jgi:RTX calcium-binding nonapeptide repeat (4 copies)
MAQVKYTGGEFIAKLESDIAEENFPFPSYLSFGSLPDEDWGSQSYDDQASKLSLNWRSTEGSSISINSNASGSDANGTSKGILKLSGKQSGTQISSSWNDSWSDKTDNKSKTVSWAYTAGTPSKDDDFNYKWAYSQKFFRNDSSPGSVISNLDFSNKDYVFNWAEYNTGTSDNWKSTISKYFFKDIQANQTYTFTGILSANIPKNEFKLNASNIKLTSSELVFETSKLSMTFSKEIWRSFPVITAEAESLEAISVGLAAWEDIFSKSDNKITVLELNGKLIDAKEGNDTILGGVGADTLVGGLGADQLTGSAGGDLFMFSAGDSDLSTKTSDLIKDFKFSEGDRIKLDGMGEINCHVRDLKEASFSSARADANKDFNEGLNVSIQFVGSRALVFVDFDADGKADSVIALTGLKVGNNAFIDYAESGEMFA